MRKTFRKTRRDRRLLFLTTFRSGLQQTEVGVEDEAVDPEKH